MIIHLYGDNYLESNGNNIQRSIKSSLKRKLSMCPEKYCEYIGITLPEKCRFCNEECSKELIDSWRNPFTQETGKECILKDKNKIKIAKDLGYNILILWSDDSIENHIKQVKNEINRIRSKKD